MCGLLAELAYALVSEASAARREGSSPSKPTSFLGSTRARRPRCKSSDLTDCSLTMRMKCRDPRGRVFAYAQDAASGTRCEVRSRPRSTARDRAHASTSTFRLAVATAANRNGGTGNRRNRFPSSSGPGHHPFKVRTRVRIPLGTPLQGKVARAAYWRRLLPGWGIAHSRERSNRSPSATNRVWESLVTPPASEAGDRWFESSHSDQSSGGS